MHDIRVGSSLLADNDAAARDNRRMCSERGVYVLNLMSGPGAGKTTLVERTVAALASEYRLAVLVGDIQGRHDADRIAGLGVEARQINTGGACHLDARQVHAELHHLDLSSLDLLIIENVGNLVCPAEFDLGEHDKAMVLSVTEGHDKPSKYPVMFHRAQTLVLNKIDLLPHTDFDIDAAVRAARAYNDDLQVFPLSARTGEGLAGWLDWLRGRAGSPGGENG